MGENAAPDVGLNLLISRTRWPIPAVKWWAIQELAILLCRDDLRAQVETPLLDELLTRKFETEVAELLCVFWLAKHEGYVPNPSLVKHVRARSPVSDLILEDLGFVGDERGEFNLPTQAAERGYPLTEDFLSAQGQSMPIIFMSVLSRLESTSKRPFTSQYAFEWERTKDLYHDMPYRDIRYFYGNPVEDMCGQFVFQDGHRGRSAYLRTLMVGAQLWKAPSHVVEERAIVTLPLDPTFAFLRPNQPPVYPAFKAELSVNPDTLAEFVRELVKCLNEQTPGSVLQTFSAPVRVSTNETIDLEIGLWAQWGAQPADGMAILKNSTTRVRTSLGCCHAEGLEAKLTVPLQNLDSIRHKVFDAAPTSGVVDMWRHGYLHADLYVRGIPMPLSTVAENVLTVEPRGSELKIAIGTVEFGRWYYWNHDWTTYHPKMVPTHVGVCLMGNYAAMPLLWEKAPASYFYLWRCKRLHRKEIYENLLVEEHSGLIVYGSNNDHLEA